MMGNILDYLDWRGDIPLSLIPFGRVDALILSVLTYVRLDGIVPQVGQEDISIGDAAKAFFEAHSEKELREDKSFTNFAPEVLRKAAESRRFGKSSLRNYVNHVDLDNELQFSAMEIETEDGIPFVSFKGTDDTIIGWKEDFNISYRTVPAEEEALAYLNYIHADTKGKIRLGGHSKGAHLAVYAGAFCLEEIRERITDIYENDGPGFNQEMMERLGHEKPQLQIHRLIPQTAIIGSLLCHFKKADIVRSDEKGVMQHNPISWQIMGGDFITEENNSKKGMLFEETFNTWIASVDKEDRKGFIDDMFSVLQAPGFTTIKEVRQASPKESRIMWERLQGIDPRSREIIEKLILIFIGNWAAAGFRNEKKKSGRKALKAEKKKKKEKERKKSEAEL